MAERKAAERIRPAAEQRMEKTGPGGRAALSKRLRMLANMVTPGNRLVDVGCDHGYLSIDLVGSCVCPGAIAMDVREGPLAAAKAHIAEAGLNDYIEVRLSDGLAGCGAGEADTLVCAGMGGRLMERILREGMEKAYGMRELVLQPQSELPQFRTFLREAGFAIIDEDAVFEEGKYYFAMKAVRSHGQGGDAASGAEFRFIGTEGSSADKCAGDTKDSPDAPAPDMAGNEDTLQHLYDLYGELLLRKKHPVLRQYLCQRESYVRMLEASLSAAATSKAERRRGEVRRELAEIQAALAFYSCGQ